MGPSKKPAILLLAAIFGLCACGAWISGESLRRSANIWGGGGAGLFARVCSATEAWGLSCTPAASSRWSALSVPMLERGEGAWSVRRVEIPVAFVGLAYFVFLGTWFLFVDRAHRGTGFAVPLLVTRLGAAFSVLCLVAMSTHLAPLCAWCVLVHVLNLALWGAVGRACRQGNPRTGTEPAQTPQASRQAARATAFALILIAALWVYRRDQLALGQQVQALKPYKTTVESLRNDPAFLMREYHAAPRAELLADRLESTPAVARLVLFTDFMCPACGCTARQLAAQAVPVFDGRLRIEVHHFPLDAACNDAVERSPHPGACEAAYAAEAARLQGGEEAFAAMQAALFAQRGPFTQEVCRQLAERIGLDEARFARDHAGEEVRRAVRADVALARALRVDGTPTMYLNGRRVTAFGVDNPVFWQAAADDWSGQRPVLVGANR